MKGAMLRKKTDLSNAKILSTDLSNAQFVESTEPEEGAILKKTIIDDCNLKGIDFSYTDLRGTIFQNITQWNARTNFEGADCQETTVKNSKKKHKGRKKHKD
jgi:uncharacterized protein YjbI with pentapeptide repeats